MAKRKSNNKHPKLPNGFGRIAEIKNKNLRNPFRAMLTVGRTEEGAPIGKILGYYSSWYAAYDALAEYHKNPYELDAQKITVADLYDKWSVEYFEEMASDSSVRTIRAAWLYVTPVFRRQNAADITPQALKTFINQDACKKTDDKTLMASDGTKARLKSMFNLMYDYAVLAGLVSVNPSRQFNLKGLHDKIERQRKDKNVITPEHEVELWKDIDYGYTRMVLINIYSTWRPEELIELTKDNIDFDSMIMRGGLKTAAGTNRIVPIHPKILPLIRYYYDRSPGDRLFYDYDGPRPLTMTYDKYRGRFKKIMFRHGWDCYSPSCPRHTFSTRAKESRMDDYARKMMMGHEITDVTDKHYTHLKLTEYLFEEIQKI